MPKEKPAKKLKVRCVMCANVGEVEISADETLSYVLCPKCGETGLEKI